LLKELSERPDSGDLIVKIDEPMRFRRAPRAVSARNSIDTAPVH